MINPFDEHDQFTCPRCGSHEFGPSGRPNEVACNGYVHGRARCCDYMYLRNPGEPQKDAATLAFDKIAEICGMKTWDYPGQVVRDVQMLKDQRDDARKAAGIHADLNAQLSRDLQGAQVDRDDALDLIEEEQWSASDDFEAEQCPWCFGLKCDLSREPGGHRLDCKAALLLRKHGREVRFQGEL